MKKEKIFGFHFVNSDEWAPIIESIKSYNYLDCNYLPFVITPNVDQIVKFEKNKELKNFFKNSFLILPDGQPIVWSSYLLKKNLKRRLAGSDLFPLLWEEIKKSNEKCLFILSKNCIGEILKKEHSNITYVVPPVFSVEKDADLVSSLVRNYKNLILKEQPKYIFIGLGFPKQEILAMKIYKELKASTKNIPLFFLLGAAFEFYTGLKRRAPVLFRKIGLEWFFRFLTEPRRLFKRYFIDDIVFLNLLIAELINNEKRK